MHRVASRDLRNHTAAVLRRVGQGDRVAVTVHGEVVAEIVPATARRPAALSRAAVTRLVEDGQADAAMTEDLRRLGEESTDDLGPPE